MFEEGGIYEIEESFERYVAECVKVGDIYASFIVLYVYEGNLESGGLVEIDSWDLSCNIVYITEYPKNDIRSVLFKRKIL